MISRADAYAIAATRCAGSGIIKMALLGAVMKPLKFLASKTLAPANAGLQRVVSPVTKKIFGQKFGDSVAKRVTVGDIGISAGLTAALAPGVARERAASVASTLPAQPW